MIRSLLFGFLLTLAAGFFSGCNKRQINPNIPDVSISISIDPNSTLFQEINVIAGWTYLDGKSGVYIPSQSRGIIVFRSDFNEFTAFERQPPENQDQCCTNGECTKLIVGSNFPFVVDTCTGNKYLIYDGNLAEGEGLYPLIRYNADYSGGILHIYN